MAVIRFTIPGRLSGKGRPRFVRANGRVFTPAKTVVMEGIARQFAADAMKGMTPLEGPLRLSVVLRINHPMSWSKKRKMATLYVTGKPDLDNVLKLIGDAGNGVVWRDDAQIAQIEFDRRYADGAEFVAVEVRTLSGARFATLVAA